MLFQKLRCCPIFHMAWCSLSYKFLTISWMFLTAPPGLAIWNVVKIVRKLLFCRSLWLHFQFGLQHLMILRQVTEMFEAKVTHMLLQILSLSAQNLTHISGHSSACPDPGWPARSRPNSKCVEDVVLLALLCLRPAIGSFWSVLFHRETMLWTICWQRAHLIPDQVFTTWSQKGM